MGNKKVHWSFDAKEIDYIEGIYKTYIICCPISNLIRYVGVTKKKLSRRANYHINSKRNDGKTLWIKWLISCGLQPIFTSIDYCGNKAKASESEEFFIRFFENIGHPLFNKCYGLGSKGVSTKGRHVMTIENREKLIERNKNRKITEETRDKWRKASTGKVRSKESIEKQFSKIIGSKRSEATKKLMSIKNSQCKKIIQYNQDKSVYKEWRTVKEACDYNKINRNCLRKFINSTNTYKNYYWSYGNT